MGTTKLSITFLLLFAILIVHSNAFHPKSKISNTLTPIKYNDDDGDESSAFAPDIFDSQGIDDSVEVIGGVHELLRSSSSSGSDSGGSSDNEPSHKPRKPHKSSSSSSSSSSTGSSRSNSGGSSDDEPSHKPHKPPTHTIQPKSPPPKKRPSCWGRCFRRKKKPPVSAAEDVN